MTALKDNEINAISGSGGWLGIAKNVVDWAGRALTVKEGISIGSDIVKDMKEHPERWEHPEYEKPWNPLDKDDSSSSACR